MSRRRLVLIAGAVAVLALVGYGLLSPSSRRTGPAIGEAAPLFEAPDLTGHHVALASERGKTVLLNFWASWCVPCIEEFPVLKRAQTRHPGVIVLGVVFNDSVGAAGSFMRAHQADWPGIQDGQSQIATAYGVGNKPGIPVTFVIDAAGVVRARHFGGYSSDGELDSTLRQAGVLA